MTLSNLTATMSVAYHLARLFAKGERNMACFEEWRALHCRTNGLSTDILNSIIRLCSPRPKFGLVTGMAGSLSPDDRQRIVDVVSRDGICVFPNPLDAGL